MSEYIRTFLVAMTPIGGLPAAIPVGLAVFNLGPVETYVISVIGAMIPIILIVLLLDPMSQFLSRHFGFFRWFFRWLFDKTRKKHSRRFELMEEIALFLFVAIPPFSGGWSAAVAAFVFGIPPKKSIPIIFFGMLVSGIITTLAVLGFRVII